MVALVPAARAGPVCQTPERPRGDARGAVERVRAVTRLGRAAGAPRFRTLGFVGTADRPERGGPRLRLIGGILVGLLMVAILLTYVVVSRPWDLTQHRPTVHRTATTNRR